MVLRLTILRMIKTLHLFTSHSSLRNRMFCLFPASPEDTHGNFDIVFPERLNIKGRAKRDLFTKSKVHNQEELTFTSRNSRLSSLLPLSIDYEQGWAGDSEDRKCYKSTKAIFFSICEKESKDRRGAIKNDNLPLKSLPVNLPAKKVLRTPRKD